MRHPPTGPLTTPQDFAVTAEHFGAKNVRVNREDAMNVTVEVEGLDAATRDHLCRHLKQHGPAGISVDVVSVGGVEDVSERRNNILTDKELLTVISALPDEWEETRELDLSEVDMETLRPLMHEHGGLVPLLEKVEHSVADPSQNDSETDAVKVENVSALFDGEREQKDDPVEDAKNAYVAGEIGILELEDRLEDAIELDYEPQALPS